MPGRKKRPNESSAPPRNGESRGIAAKKGFTEIWVAGFKSIIDEQLIEIRPLTILAGANSSGKSSIIQPLLLLKQTLEAAYDPGALLLNGPNVKFTSASQLVSRVGPSLSNERFQVGMRANDNSSIELSFQRAQEKGFRIERMKFTGTSRSRYLLEPSMSHQHLISAMAKRLSVYKPLYGVLGGRLGVIRDRCFLGIAFTYPKGSEQNWITNEEEIGSLVVSDSTPFGLKIRKIIHVPGIRGNPERTYPVTAVSGDFPGLFQNYAASTSYI
jgi:hypothetical protein